MRRALYWFTVTLLLMSAVALAEREVQDYSKAIDTFKQAETVAPYFDTAYGYAVFPTIGKGGIGIGGAHGKGQVYVGGTVVGFTSMTQVSIGFQLGGQAFSQVIFFEDQRAFDDFTSGSFEFDAQASAIAVTASAQASAATTSAAASAGAGGPGKHADVEYRKGMLVFVMGKGGLMYQATVGGQGFTYDAVGATAEE